MERREFICCLALGCASAISGCGLLPFKERKEIAMMDSQDKSLSLAVCGLDCTACPLYRAQTDPELAEKLAADFSTDDWKANPEKCQCSGCRGDRGKHWSSNCKILQCCVDEKKLDNCSHCVDFPCEMLEEWAAKDRKYADALSRLMMQLAPCGIDCSTCDIRLAKDNPDIAERLVKVFVNMGHEDAEPVWFQCGGCHGNREIHWSQNCVLLSCCIDEKHLRNCSQCPEFMCEKLDKFANDGHKHHKAAVERLERIVASRMKA